MNIKELQKCFFETIQSYQEYIVSEKLNKFRENDDIEDLLYDISYDMIYSVMELIDGYSNDRLNIDLVDKKTGESLRKGIELHDTCAAYLYYEKPKR